MKASTSDHTGCIGYQRDVYCNAPEWWKKSNEDVSHPTVLEKHERKLLISVHSEGAIKVLSIIDSSYHVLNDLKSLHVPQLKDKGRQTQKYDSFVNYKERLSVDIPFLGISLMNSHPEELLFACAKNAKVNFVQSLDRQLFSFQIASLQIDNQLHTTPYPVILFFNCVNKGSVANQMKSKDNSAKLLSGTSQIASSNLHEPVFSLAVAKWRNEDTSLVSFESISLRIADFYLEIEQEIVLRLFEFCKTASSRLQNRVFQNIDFSQNLFFPVEFTGEITRNGQYSTRLDEKYLNCTGTTLLTEDCKRSCLLAHVVPIGGPWQKIQLSARKQKKIYVELFDMEPIKLTLSFSSSPWILRNGVITSGESLIHRGLMALADVEGAKIHFKQLVLSHQIASWESIQEILVSHYTRQFLHEMYKVFGSAGVIGNPVGFARSLGLGIKDFFSLPIWSVFQSPAGLITGMAQGTTSLLSNTVYAISDATSQFSKAAHKGIVAFTFDDQTASMIERQQKGMASQSKGVINEFLEGLTGVLQSPIKGAEKHGLPGVLSGIALGVTGLVARPTASILEVTGKTAQSIRNRSRIYQMGYRCFRVRLPRPLSAESPLKPYSWEEAVGTHVLTETDMKLRDETLIMCKALKQCGEHVLITSRIILVVSCSSLIDLGKPNFEGVPADPKWVLQSEIRMDSVILADNDGEIVHIVGSGSDTSFRQNLQQQKRGNGGKGKLWNKCQNPLPLFQTNLEFRCPEEADEFLRVLMCMIERGKEQGWGSRGSKVSLVNDFINLNVSRVTEKSTAEYIWGIWVRSKARTLNGPVTNPSELLKSNRIDQTPGQDGQVILCPLSIFPNLFRPCLLQVFD
ncbi:UNVERIFIED_CONTAM: Vacuolar protein sorting-associated protein 13 [Sesamum radiatum]|uniref:Vacuolar protein sorting-associated protein 13 n=1 Tax=Sesamum radiatum TaxID=300843 RepID=A0AAW2N2C9_SESRA